MKLMVWLLVVILSTCLLAGCATTSSNRSTAQAPSSQQAVFGEARTRAKAHANLGFEYYAQNQFGFALQEAKTALSNDDSYTPAYNLLALVYMSLSDNKSAEEAFMHARQLSPGDPEVANNYGWFLCRTKREKQAFQYFNEALKNTLYPTPWMALTNSAACSMQIRDYKAAESYLQQALALIPNSTRALLLMAKVKYQQKHYEEARGYIAELHRNSEPNAESALLAYRIARLTGDRDDEARYLSLMHKNFPNSDEYKKLIQGALE
ncbi:MAG: type IV pilus biogenesis/stability protein PilW [Georgfuchsia sp.]